MSLDVYLSLEAENDLNEVVTYLARENPTAAHAFVDAFSKFIERLSDHPEIGHYREDLTDKPVKFFTFKWHYLVVYKPTNPLEIVRVLSGYRDMIDLIG
jgi:plasmid stabilization system protein ParE